MGQLLNLRHCTEEGLQRRPRSVATRTEVYRTEWTSSTEGDRSSCEQMGAPMPLRRQFQGWGGGGGTKSSLQTSATHRTPISPAGPFCVENDLNRDCFLVMEFPAQTHHVVPATLSSAVPTPVSAQTLSCLRVKAYRAPRPIVPLWRGPQGPAPPSVPPSPPAQPSVLNINGRPSLL